MRPCYDVEADWEVEPRDWRRRSGQKQQSGLAGSAVCSQVCSVRYLHSELSQHSMTYSQRGGSCRRQLDLESQPQILTGVGTSDGTAGKDLLLPRRFDSKPGPPGSVLYPL